MARKPSPRLTAAAVEATAAAFLAAFKALLGKVKWRVVRLIEEYEDELDATQLAADMAANPDDCDPKNSVPIEQVIAELEAKVQNKKGQPT